MQWNITEKTYQIEITQCTEKLRLGNQLILFNFIGKTNTRNLRNHRIAHIDGCIKITPQTGYPNTVCIYLKLINRLIIR